MSACITIRNRNPIGFELTCGDLTAFYDGANLPELAVDSDVLVLDDDGTGEGYTPSQLAYAAYEALHNDLSAQAAIETATTNDEVIEVNGEQVSNAELHSIFQQAGVFKIAS
jgi:hypothetical protein